MSLRKMSFTDFVQCPLMRVTWIVVEGFGAELRVAHWARCPYWNPGSGSFCDSKRGLCHCL